MKPLLCSYRRVSAMLAFAATMLTGCGMWQSVKETTVDATRAVFYSKVKQMNLDIAGREALNQSAQGQSLPVLLRIYQLRDAKAFEKATYAQLVAGDAELLKADLLASSDLTLAPGTTAHVSAPMADDAKAVGVVGFFRNQTRAEWQVVIPKSQWKQTDPVRLSVNDNRIELEQ